jgi:glycosyl transferase family 25
MEVRSIAMPQEVRNLGLDGILVINVRSFVERRKFMKAQLSRLGLECEFVHEYDACDIDSDTDMRHFCGAGLRPNQKSCSMKHIAAMARMVSRGWRRMLVLEDDAVLSPDFLQGLKRALRESSARRTPHVVYLGSGANQYTPRSRRVEGQSLYPNTRGRLTDSYLIGANEARLRLDWIAANRMDLPIDHAFDAMDTHLGIDILWFENPIVEQGSKNGTFSTTLEPCRHQLHQQLRFRWKKLWQKHVRQLWR